jgi:hypothetical protein
VHVQTAVSPVIMVPAPLQILPPPLKMVPAHLNTPPPKTHAHTHPPTPADLFDDAPIGRVSSPESVLGARGALKGEGDAGRGVVVDLMMRRALPRQPGSEMQAAAAATGGGAGQE